MVFPCELTEEYVQARQSNTYIKNGHQPASAHQISAPFGYRPATPGRTLPHQNLARIRSSMILRTALTIS